MSPKLGQLSKCRLSLKDSGAPSERKTRLLRGPTQREALFSGGTFEVI